MSSLFKERAPKNYDLKAYVPKFNFRLLTPFHLRGLACTSISSPILYRESSVTNLLC